jgi:hypothetical protein
MEDQEAMVEEETTMAGEATTTTEASLSPTSTQDITYPGSWTMGD